MFSHNERHLQPREAKKLSKLRWYRRQKDNLNCTQWTMLITIDGAVFAKDVLVSNDLMGPNRAWAAQELWKARKMFRQYP